ncbi:MAG: epoxyqueuosine reductase QueH [Clostridia bacterium]|nr:epoxyqueuosine reductase QueH [Clostridia bacterium]
MKRILLHICCAPCSVMCIESLREEGFQIDGLWFNPNIHPFTEYKSRRDTLIEYAKSIELPLEVIDDYGLREFVRKTYDCMDDRCQVCYDLRLERVAELAKANGFDGFSTTLLISPYQRHDLIRERGEFFAQKYACEFLYRDFRPLFRQGQQKARDGGLYMQKYCGCVFSEEERYSPKYRTKNKDGK